MKKENGIKSYMGYIKRWWYLYYNYAAWLEWRRGFSTEYIWKYDFVQKWYTEPKKKAST